MTEWFSNERFSHSTYIAVGKLLVIWLHRGLVVWLYARVLDGLSFYSRSYLIAQTGIKDWVFNQT